MSDISSIDFPVLVRRSRRRLSGILVYFLGCAMLLVTVIACFGIVGHRPMGPFTVAIAAVVSLVVALTLLVAAETFFMPSATEALARDRRLPVVYLRPFGEDKERTYDWISVGETYAPITAKAEDFLLALNAIGPLISIAQPNWLARWGMHPLGVYRDFIGEGDWQARVCNWLDQAGMVVLAMGDSPGIEWEIAQVRRRIQPQSLLIYLPPRPIEAWTRKGRHEKERAIYEHFAPLVEKHFGITLPPFSAATHVIGFAVDGTAVVAPEAGRRRSIFTEYEREADAIRSQLITVLTKVRPDVCSDTGTRVGRTGRWRRVGIAGRWWRIVGAMLVALAGVGICLTGIPANVFLTLAASSLIDLAIVAGWVMLARYFHRGWVWIIPLLLGMLVVLNTGAQILMQVAGSDGPLLFHSSWYLVSIWLLRLGYAGAVLALGIAVAGLRASGA